MRRERDHPWQLAGASMLLPLPGGGGEGTGASNLLKSLYEEMRESAMRKAAAAIVTATEVVAFLQNPSNEPQASLQVVDVSPLYARYRTSVETAPAARTT